VVGSGNGAAVANGGCDRATPRGESVLLAARVAGHGMKGSENESASDPLERKGWEEIRTQSAGLLS